MNSTVKILSWMTLGFTVPGIAIAQQQQPQQQQSQSQSQSQPQAESSPAKSTAQSEAGEPRADTSSPAPQVSAEPASRPAQAEPRKSATPPARGAGSAQKSGPKVDRLDLGVATVTGDREQPKVMYIVPWKKSDIGDLTARPMNSLVDEILAPVDRDVFKREVVYYRAVQADASQNGASPKPAQQGEK